MEHIPWVEKYRPKKLEKIVLETNNKKIFNNIIKAGYFPNLLLYGPPGTGKTTTIINLINKYQSKNKQKRKGLKIHLNASDDRGIDIIRNQINLFVNTKTLFGKGLKFVILDEVDYMTKNAQKALRYLIQQYNNNIRFCLICNYISRINIALQNEFIRLKFCRLPEDDILYYLTYIVKQENLNITHEQLKSIKQLFKSDIRSMINYLQSNQYIGFKNKIITDDFLRQFFVKLKEYKSENKLITYLEQKCIDFNIDKAIFIKLLINYLLMNHIDIITSDQLSLFSKIIHSNGSIDYKLIYFLILVKDINIF